MDRVVVFIDYQNVHGWARRQFLPYGADAAHGHIFPLKVGELLAARRKRPSELSEFASTAAGRTPSGSRALPVPTTGRRPTGNAAGKSTSCVATSCTPRTTHSPRRSRRASM